MFYFIIYYKLLYIHVRFVFMMMYNSFTTQSVCFTGI